jgi:hypothetical protein
LELRVLAQELLAGMAGTAGATASGSLANLPAEALMKVLARGFR